jgi:drug/metabolite transporter (DMT)-like permease
MCTLIWGSTWLAIKIGNADMAPLNGAGLRFAISSCILFILQIVFRAPMPQGREPWSVVLFVGVVLVGIDYGLIYWAEQFLPTGLTSVLFAVMPLFTLLLARALGLEKITIRKLAGILLCISGVALLCWDTLSWNRDALLPALGVLGAAFCSASTTTVTKKHGRDLHPVSLNAWSSAIGCLCLYAGAAARGEGLQWPSTSRGWIAVSYLSLGGSVTAFLLYYWLLKRWDASKAGLVSVLTPMLAVALGVVAGDERLDGHLVAGATLVLAGVFVATRVAISRPRTPERN